MIKHFIRRLRWIVAAAMLAGMMQPGFAATVDAIPSGSGQLVADLDGKDFPVFTYRPDGCAIAGLLLVFHGLGQNAHGYRDHAKPLADSLCMMVVAPLFDKHRFPSWSYQRGGIVHDGKLRPQADWTVRYAPLLAAWAQARAGRPDLPYALLGHSGGAQFLSRVAAFLPVAATRIVIANPSTWVLPSLDVDVPYGFGGLGSPAEGEEDMRRYLAAPITVLLGGADTGTHELAMDAQAMAQGPTRLARGQAAFAQAKAAADRHGWPFNWRLSIVPGVGHTAARMFASPQALDALRN